MDDDLKQRLGEIRGIYNDRTRAAIAAIKGRLFRLEKSWRPLIEHLAWLNAQEGLLPQNTELMHFMEFLHDEYNMQIALKNLTDNPPEEDEDEEDGYRAVLTLTVPSDASPDSNSLHIPAKNPLAFHMPQGWKETMQFSPDVPEDVEILKNLVTDWALRYIALGIQPNLRISMRDGQVLKCEPEPRVEKPLVKLELVK